MNNVEIIESIILQINHILRDPILSDEYTVALLRMQHHLRRMKRDLPLDLGVSQSLTENLTRLT